MEIALRHPKELMENLIERYDLANSPARNEIAKIRPEMESLHSKIVAHLR
jgi:hypothetical protein